jgi:hypothetical protein
MSTAAAHATTSITRARKMPQGGQVFGRNDNGGNGRAECPPARAAT